MKIRCPKCANVHQTKFGLTYNFMWDADDADFFGVGLHLPLMKVTDFPHCPLCKGPLEKSKTMATHVVMKNELGEYIDVSVQILPKEMQKILQGFDCSGETSFGEEQDDGSIDDHNSVWGGAGPDCSIIQGEPVYNLTSNDYIEGLFERGEEMNIFTNKSLKFQLEINRMRIANEAAKREVAEINRIAKESGISAKYVRLNEKIRCR